MNKEDINLLLEVIGNKLSNNPDKAKKRSKGAVGNTDWRKK